MLKFPHIFPQKNKNLLHIYSTSQKKTSSQPIPHQQLTPPSQWNHNPLAQGHYLGFLGSFRLSKSLLGSNILEFQAFCLYTARHFQSSLPILSHVFLPTESNALQS